MRKNLLCPNLSHPDAQFYINKLGLRGFYRMYIENGYGIPSPYNENNYDTGELNISESLAGFLAINPHLTEKDFNLLFSKIDEAFESSVFASDLLSALKKGTKLTKEDKQRLAEENASKLVISKKSLVLNLLEGGNQPAEIILYQDGTHVVYFKQSDGTSKRFTTFKDLSFDSIDKWIEKNFNGAQDVKDINFDKTNQRTLKKIYSDNIVSNTDAVIKEQIKSLFKLYATSRSYSDIESLKFNSVSNNTKNEFKSFVDSLSIAGNTSVEDMILINKELFSAIQQSEITDNIVALMYDRILSNSTSEDKLNLNSIFNDIYDRFNNTYKDALSRSQSTENPKEKQYYTVLSDRFKNVINNFNSFYDEAVRKLNASGFKVKDPKARTQVILDNQLEFNDNVDDSGDLESSEALYRKLDYSDEANFALSSKDTASAHLKQALSLVPKFTVDADGNLTEKNEKSYLNMPVYEGIDTVWGELLFLLNNVPIGEKLDFLRKSDNPRHQKIVSLIESNPNTKIRNEFESVFSKQYANFITIKISKPTVYDYGQGPFTVRNFNVFNTNRNSANDIIYDDWHENFISKENFYEVNEQGEALINNNYISALNELILSINNFNQAPFTKKDFQQKHDTFRSVFDKLSTFGLEISKNTVDYWINKAIKDGNPRELTRVIGNVTKVKDAMIPKKDKDNKLIRSFDMVNPFFTATIEDGVKTTKNASSAYNIMSLVQVQNRINPVVFEASFITGDGKSKYAFSNNSYLTHQFNRIKDNAEFRTKLGSTAFAKDSIYLEKLNSDPVFKSRFELFYLDSMGNDSKSFLPNKQFKNMTEKEKEFTRIALYMNNGVHTNQKQYSAGTGIFISLINSDKTTHPAYKVPKLNTLGNFINIRIKDEFSDMNEIPKSGHRVGDAYFNTKENLLYYISPDKTWKTLANTKGYDKMIGRTFRGYDISDDTYENIIRKLYMSERARVSSTLERIKQHGKDDPNSIKNYHNGGGLGAKFLIFEGLNEIMFDESGNLKAENNVKDLVKAHLKSVFSDIAVDQIDYWNELELTRDNINNLNYNVNKLGHSENMTDKEYTDFALEYSLNQFVFMFNQMQLFSGDLALHDKKNASAAWINFFKRMAKDIAPGLDYNFKDKPYFNTIVIKDVTKASKHFEHYKKILGDIAEEYGSKPDGSDGKLNIADAQEYTTLDEHIEVMRAGGRLDNTPEINAAIERLKNGTNTYEDINTILPAFQPMKPVYVEMVPNGEIAEVHYIKSSSFPLIPSLTRGTPLDKLRLAMENHKDSNGNPRPIGRAAFESAVKLGTKGEPVEVFDQSGNININSLPDAFVRTLPRSGFRIQMELPDHGSNGNNTEGTQFRKLIHNNMENSGISRINGKEYNNKHVKNVFNELHYWGMVDGYKGLVKDLGFNESGVLINPTKMIELLREEAESKGYSINDINSIQLVHEGGKFRFKLPLALNKSSEKFQAILNSMVMNRVIKRELPGFMAVQASSVGFKLTDPRTYLEKAGNNSITYIDPNDTELNFATVSKESGKDIIDIDAKKLNISGGESILDKLKEYLDANPNLDVHPYQVKYSMFVTREEKLNIENYIADRYSSIIHSDIIVPNYLGGINLNDYIVDGKLDTSRLPKELLKVIGIRIPTQGHNSMMVFNVKGFLSHNSGEMAIVPEEIVVQMGADFDVDKLFLYRYEYENNDGKLTKVDSKLDGILSGEVSMKTLTEKQRNNAILDMMFSKLSEGSVIHQLLLPNGFGNLPNVLKDVQSKLSKTNTHNFTTRNQNTIHSVNNDGKVGVAVFSLFSTFNRKLQDVDNIGFKGINFKFDNSEIGSIAGLFTNKGKFKSDVILYLQSAAVDNSKEQILGVLNINDKTINIAGTMALLGLDETQIAYFLSQPIIKDVLRKIDNNNDSVALESKYNSLSSVINEYLETYEANIPELSEGMDISKIDINTDELKSNYTKNSDEVNYKILRAFNALSAASKIVGENMSVANTDSGGLGSTFSETLTRDMRYNNLKKSNVDSNSIGYGFSDLFLNNREPSTAALNIITSSINLYNQVFDFYDKNVLDTLDYLSSVFNFKLDANNVKTIFGAIKSYIYSDASLLDQDDLSKLRYDLLYGKNNIADRFYAWASQKGNKNLIAKRIKARKSTKKGVPNTLITVNTKATSTSDDINRVTSHFYAMLTSANKVERDLAEDMVKYFYLTGGNFSPTSIGKYLNNDILDKYNFSSKLRNNMSNYLKELNHNRGSFLIQFFQNNPRLIKMGNLKDFKGTYKKGNLISEYSLSLPVISLYDSSKSLYRLFVKQTDKLYKEIPVINEGKNISHYEYSKDLTFNFVNLANIQAIEGYSQEAISSMNNGSEGINIEDVQNDLENYDVGSLTEVPVNGTRVAEELFNYSPRSNVKNVLNRIINTSSVPQYLRNLATDMLNNFADANNLSLNYTLDSLGSMKGTELRLNVEKMLAISKENNLPFEDIFAKTFLHELLHGATSFYLNPINIGTLDETQRKAVSRIKDLHRLYIQNYGDQSKLNRFISIYNIIKNSIASKKDHNLSNEDIRFFNENKNDLYGYVSVDEFITEGLTNPDFRDKLKSNNFWTKLVEALRKLLGIGRTDLDALYDSVSELLPYTRPNMNNYVKSTVNSLISQNKVIEGRIIEVVDKLSDSFVNQREAFSKEFNIREGDELYPGMAEEIMQRIIRDGQYSNLLVTSIEGKAQFFQRDMPTLSDIKQAILENYQNETHYNLEAVEEKAVEKKEKSLLDKFSDKYLILLKQRRDYLKAKIKAHQDKYGTLIHMESELRSLRNTISKLEDSIKDSDGRAFSYVLDLADLKLNEIQYLYDSDNLDSDLISESIKYLNTIMNFNKYLNMKPGSKYEELLDELSTKANSLSKKLLRKSSLILNEELKRELDLDIDTYKLITEGSKDINAIGSDLLDYSNINNKYIQSLGYLIEKKQFDTSRELESFSEEFKNLINEYQTKYGNTNLDEFLSYNSEGKWTGNFLSVYQADYYSQRHDPKFRGANTRLIITEENKQKYINDRNFIAENYPDQLKRWDKENDLKLYEKMFKRGLTTKVATKAHRYFTEIPLKKWLDPKWVEINSLDENDPKRKLFMFMRETLKGINNRNYKDSNYLGDVPKSNTELLLEGKVKGALGALHSDLKSAIDNNELILTKDVDAITGDLHMVIPVRFFGGKLNSENKTRDLARIIETVKAQDIALQNKYEIEPLLMMYQNLINNSVQVTDAKRRDTDEDFVVINSKPKNMSELSLFMIQNYLYNYSRDKSASEAKYGKYVDMGSHYLRVKGMGWNPFSAIGNLLQSITSNLGLAAAKQYFNGEDYNFGLTKALSTFTNNKEAKKIEKLFNLLDLQPIVNEVMFDKSRILSASHPDKLNSLDPMFLTQRVEMFNQSHTMISVLHNMKVQDSEGNTVSVYEAFDDNGNWNPKYGENPLSDRDTLFKARMKMRKIIIDVHGNYVRPIKAKTNFIKRAALVFRTWLPQAINSRFGSYNKDEFLDMETEGRYRTVFNMARSGKLKSGIMALWGKESSDLSLMEMANLRRTLAEMAMISALWAIGLMLKHLVDWDDMDDEAKMALTYQINMLGRAQNDLLLLVNPATFKEMTKDPIPMLSIVNDVYGVFNGVQRTVTGDGLYKTGSREGQSVLIKEIMDLIPFATQIDKNLSYSQNLFSDR